MQTKPEATYYRNDSTTISTANLMEYDGGRTNGESERTRDPIGSDNLRTIIQLTKFVDLTTTDALSLTADFD